VKASKFSDAQKAFILKQGADGVPVADICRKAGISQATYFNWKKKYDGMLPPDMRRLSRRPAQPTSWRTRTASCASWWPTSRSIGRCCRTSSAENCEACSQTRAGGRDAW
jgi:hypothetical protein